MTDAVTDTIAAWHGFVESRDPAALDALLANDVVFRSPAVHTPQEGKAITSKYLLAAMQVLNTPDFHYVEEWLSDRSAVLQFACTVDGLAVSGVDIIGWNDDGQIDRFTVMIRPLKALHGVVAAMAAALGISS